MKKRIYAIGTVLLGLAVAGLLVAASGIIPVKASAGHWPVTQWFLRFAMQRSISTHSLRIKAPKLDDPGLVLKGAGHYETGCRSCHGSPGKEQSPIALRMLPPPPLLPERIRKRDPEELFYTVKHGLKFTGMPAWPTQQRDDEVWAMVAFLHELPDLDESGYRRLVYGDSGAGAPPPLPSPPPPTPVTDIQSCVRCHGADGLGRGSVFPKLAGQRLEYLENALEAYARGERHSGIMEPVAAALNPEAIQDLSRFFASLDVSEGTPSPQDIAAIARGKEIAQHGIPSQRVPSCIDCHGPSGHRVKAAYPALAGQPSGYLVLQLQLFNEDRRGGSSHAHLMRPVATRLTPEQMRDVAIYFESLRGDDP